VTTPTSGVGMFAPAWAASFEQPDTVRLAAANTTKASDPRMRDLFQAFSGLVSLAE
jgi:hypothetical protein